MQKSRHTEHKDSRPMKTDQKTHTRYLLAIAEIERIEDEIRDTQLAYWQIANAMTEAQHQHALAVERSNATDRITALVAERTYWIEVRDSTAQVLYPAQERREHGYQSIAPAV